MEASSEAKKQVEYTLAVALNTQIQGSASGYSYKYVTDPGTFELVMKVLQILKDGVGALKDVLFTSFSWSDFVSGGTEGTPYYGNIDATGDIITYNTVADCVKRVIYFNQTEEPWAGNVLWHKHYRERRLWTDFPCNRHINFDWTKCNPGNDLRLFHTERGICVWCGNQPFFSNQCGTSLGTYLRAGRKESDGLYHPIPKRRENGGGNLRGLYNYRKRKRALYCTDRSDK